MHGGVLINTRRRQDRSPTRRREMAVCRHSASAVSPFRFLEQGIDTTTAEGRMLYRMLTAVAEFQKDLIQTNTHESLSAARARGRNGGRKTQTQPSSSARCPGQVRLPRVDGRPNRRALRRAPHHSLQPPHHRHHTQPPRGRGPGAGPRRIHRAGFPRQPSRLQHSGPRPRGRAPRRRARNRLPSPAGSDASATPTSRSTPTSSRRCATRQILEYRVLVAGDVLGTIARP
ncbi:recombinase family protein [Saccharopolyspora halophila]|uniref:recombinase family protein n=1 Tax=Saccharopolyspora halophila TaxID=405551 RepID=UPI0031DDE82D